MANFDPVSSNLIEPSIYNIPTYILKYKLKDN